MTRPVALLLLLAGYAACCFWVFPFWSAVQGAVSLLVEIPIILAATKPKSLLGAFRWFAEYKWYGALVVGLTVLGIGSILFFQHGRFTLVQLILQGIWIFFGFWMFGAVKTYRER